MAFSARLRDDLLEATHHSYTAVSAALPAAKALAIIEDAFQLFKNEPCMLEISPCTESGEEVVVVGDTHGQFHDVVRMLELIGQPSPSRTYVFNGDFVDRGAWGMEVLMLLLTLKLAAPANVFLLRGNHESSTCTKFYGFKGEVDTKYSPAPYGQPPTGLPEGVAPPVRKPSEDAKALYKAFKRLFSMLPLAALIGGKTLVLHGGLFRQPNASRKACAKRGRRGPGNVVPELGSLDDLRASSKGGLDPDGCGASVVAADVLWSDPVGEPGLHNNDTRGVGLIFGPDVTQAFLQANGLSLIIRSHEGPDARERRTDLPQILAGHSTDHVTPAGRLVTVFSAPDYPQFQDGPVRYNNKGAVAVLSGPTGYCSPAFVSFDAAHPRPTGTAFYDYLSYAETDEELGGGSDALSSASSFGGSDAGEGADGAEGGCGGEGEVDQLAAAVNAAEEARMAGGNASKSVALADAGADATAAATVSGPAPTEPGGAPPEPAAPSAAPAPAAAAGASGPPADAAPVSAESASLPFEAHARTPPPPPAPAVAEPAGSSDGGADSAVGLSMESPWLPPPPRLPMARGGGGGVALLGGGPGARGMMPRMSAAAAAAIPLPGDTPEPLMVPLVAPTQAAATPAAAAHTAGVPAPVAVAVAGGGEPRGKRQRVATTPFDL